MLYRLTTNRISTYSSIIAAIIKEYIFTENDHMILNAGSILAQRCERSASIEPALDSPSKSMRKP